VLPLFEQNWDCKALTTICNYFIIANYTWIFMEGVYLHNLIFLALFSDTSAITHYVILGWGTSCVF
jgi:parathyroid hormone receptor 1